MISVTLQERSLVMNAGHLVVLAVRTVDRDRMNAGHVPVLVVRTVDRDRWS